LSLRFALAAYGERMKMFWKKELEPQPVAVEPDREQELLDALHKIEKSRDEITEALKDLKKNHTLIRDGVECFKTDHVTGAQELRAVWNGLLAADGKLLQSRSAILRELAFLKTGFRVH
jgi:hypothetical protein